MSGVPDKNTDNKKIENYFSDGKIEIRKGFLIMLTALMDNVISDNSLNLNIATIATNILPEKLSDNDPNRK